MDTSKYGKIDGLDKKVSRLLYGTANPPMLAGEDVDEVLDAALECGIQTFDTARGYGKAENVLGRWMKKRGCRDDVVVLSKCGDVKNGVVKVDREVIRSEMAQSLEALQTDYIDIFLLHRDDPEVPVSEVIDTLNEAKREGKIRIFGVSNWTHQRIAEANNYAMENGLYGFSVSSPHFGLAEQICDLWGGGCVTITGDGNEEAREWYRKNQMPVLAYSGLARGFMSGKVKSTDENSEALKSLLDPFAIKGYVSHRNFLRLARCEELAKKKNCTVAQIAMGWMYTQGLNLYTAAATTKPERLQENLRALYIDFSQEDINYLSEV